MVTLEKSIQPVIESVYESLTDLEKKIADYFYLIMSCKMIYLQNQWLNDCMFPSLL